MDLIKFLSSSPHIVCCATLEVTDDWQVCDSHHLVIIICCSQNGDAWWEMKQCIVGQVWVSLHLVITCSIQIEMHQGKCHNAMWSKLMICDQWKRWVGMYFFSFYVFFLAIWCTHQYKLEWNNTYECTMNFYLLNKNIYVTYTTARQDDSYFTIGHIWVMSVHWW